MDIDDIINEFGHLFNVVSEPAYSKEKLIEYQKKYPLFTTQDVYWLYQVQGFQTEVTSIIPDVDDWCYYYERFLRYKGDPFELKCNYGFEDAQLPGKIKNIYMKKGEDIISSPLFVTTGIFLTIMSNIKAIRFTNNFSYF